MLVLTWPVVSLGYGPPETGTPFKGHRHTAGGAPRGQIAVQPGRGGGQTAGIIRWSPPEAW